MAAASKSLKIFLTGVTGYIGGDLFYTIFHQHRDFQYTLLVRTTEKADQIRQVYSQSNIRCVIGDLDDSQLLQDEASQADVVVHTADSSDHEGAARAIATGLIQGHTPKRPGYWIHTGGTGILTYTDSENDYAGLGKWSDKQYDDLSGVEELTSLPDHAFHRNVDKIVLETGGKHGDVVKTVIVCPPTIYGRGRGPFNMRSRQVYELASLILKKNYVPIVGQGKARWNNVHVHDLSDLFGLLVDKASKGDLDPEIWGEKGYMFAEDGEHLWTELSRDIALKAVQLGYLSEEPKDYHMDQKEALDVAGFEAVSWGLNSRGKAERAKRHLGWRPSRASIEEHISEFLEDEHKRLVGS